MGQGPESCRHRTSSLADVMEFVVCDNCSSKAISSKITAKRYDRCLYFTCFVAREEGLINGTVVVFAPKSLEVVRVDEKYFTVALSTPK